MDNEEIVKYATKGINALISIVVAANGVKSAKEDVLDPIVKIMVDEGRGPTDEDLDTVFADLKARSDLIQGA